MLNPGQKANRRKVLGVAGAAVALGLLPGVAEARGLASGGDRLPRRTRAPLVTQQSTAAAVASASAGTCGPAIATTVAYATGLTGSPAAGPHTHIFAVTLVSGTLVDGNKVRVLGATSGPLQQFPLHIHVIDSTGILGQACGFSTQNGGHSFMLSAADFVVPGV